MNDKQEIDISLSKEHADQIEVVRKMFGDFKVDISAEHMRLSAEDLAMQVTIFLGGAFLGGVSWDVLKAAIRKLRDQYPKAGISIRDKEPILFSIKPDQTVSVLVVPDRAKEFEHIKTLDDLISYLRKSNTDWREIKLGDVGRVSMCKRILKKQTSESGDIPFFKIGTFGRKPNAFISKKVYDDYKQRYSFPKKGDILISASGTIGRTVVYDGQPAYYQDSNIVWIDNDGSMVLNPYLLYVYSRVKWQTTSGTIARLYNDNVRRIKIRIPKIPEQKRIVAVLETWDKAISSLEKKIKLKGHLKKGLMQQLLTGKKRLPGFSGEWEEKKLGDVLTIGSGRDYKHLSSGDIPVFGTGGYMLSVNEALYSGESVFIGRKGTIDKPVYFNGDFWTVDTLFYTYNFQDTTPKYIYFLFQEIDWYKYNEASGVPSLSKKTIENIKVDLPSLVEQKEISEVIDVVDKEITHLLDKVNLLRDQKTYLLNNLVTGKIRTPENMKIYA